MRLPARLAVPPILGVVLAAAMAAVPASAAPTGTVPSVTQPASALSVGSQPANFLKILSVQCVESRWMAHVRR